METLVTTLAVSFIIVVFAVVLLGVGWILTGKSKLRLGQCGRDPNKSRNEEGCGTNSTCSLCEKPEDKSDDKKNGNV